MTPVERIQLDIAQAIAERAREGDRRGRVAVNAITDVVKRHWLQLTALAKRGGSRADVKAAASKLVHQMTAATEAAIEPLLKGVVDWGFNTAFDVWESYLPAQWWKFAFPDDPALVLLEGVEFNFPEPGGPGPRPGRRGSLGKRTALDRIIGNRRKFKPAPTAPALKQVVPPAPAGKQPQPKKLKPSKRVSPAAAARVKARIKPKPVDVLKIVRSRGWKGRMKQWTKKITDFDRVAELIADGVDRKLKFETIVNRVKPLVQNYAASARRLVRTETACIENKLLEITFKEFSNIIDGFQIINPLDERTRPTHAIRAGRIYWNDRRKKPHASERPELPDAPNCRCTYAPVLNAPAPEELLKGPRVDTRTYAGFFNNLSDKEKSKIVGRERWELMKKKTPRPSWFDAVDDKTGRLISPNKLKKEQPRSTLARRKKIRSRLGKDIAAARKTLKYWPPEET